MNFLFGLPFLGVIGDISLKLLRGVFRDDLCAQHFYAMTYVHAPYILVCDIEILKAHVVEDMVLWILGSKGPHKISGGQLLMVESVLRGTYYGWAQMYLTIFWHGLNQASLEDGDLCFQSFCTHSSLRSY